MILRKKGKPAPFPDFSAAAWLSGTEQHPSPASAPIQQFKLKSGINVAPYGLPPFIPF